MSFTETS
jgi:hypothetical protein